MLWPNFNSPDVLWKKLDNVKDYVIVWIVKFLRGTQGQEGRMQEKVVNFFSYTSISPMLWPNLNSSGDLWKKLDNVKDYVIVWIVEFFRATQEW